MSVLPPFYPDLLDPHQSRALSACSETEHVWMHGPDRAKRLQLLVHILHNNLLQEQRTLICLTQDDETALLELLTSMQLDHLAMSLHGTINAGTVAALQVARKKDVREDTGSQSDLALNQFHTWHHSEEVKYRTMERQMFGEMTWKELVDKRAQGPQDTYQSQLAAALVTSDFELSQQEYWHIRGRIKTFQRLRVLRTPSFDLLDCLNSAIFTRSEESHVKAGVQQELADLTSRGRELLKNIGELVNQYRQDISSAQYETHDQLRDGIHEIENMLSSGELQFGPEFYAESTFSDITNRFKRSLSKKSRSMHMVREQVRSVFIEMVEALLNLPIKQSPISEEILDQPLTMEYVAEQIQECRKVLEHWSRQIDARAADHKRRLNAQNIPGGHVLRQMIRDVETQITDYIGGVNQRAVFSETVEINALSLEKRSLVIKDVVTLCMKLQDAMVDFEAYFLWRSFWGKLDTNIRTLLEGLDIMDEKDQVPAFDAWYFENVLDQIPPSQVAQPDDRITSDTTRERELGAVLSNHIKSVIRNERHSAFKEMRTSQKALLGHIAKGRTRELNEELRVIPAMDLFRLFPVVLCRPADLRDYGYYCNMLCVIDTHGHDYKAYLAQAPRCVLLTDHAPARTDEINQAFRIAHLNIHCINAPFTWNTLSATGKLGHLQDLTSHLSPYLEDLNVYNCKEMQILSFLGEICDQHILSELNMPYKVVGDDDNALTVAHLTEAFLDTRKPIVMLTRDKCLGFHFNGHLRWQHQTISLFKQCGVPVCNVWSLQIKQSGMSALEDVIRSLDSMRAQPRPAQETPNLTSHDDRSPAHELSGETAVEKPERSTSDLRSGTKEMGGVPA